MLDRRRVLVVGASSGLGRACAVQLAARDASVFLLGRRAAELALTATACRAAPWLRCDVRDPAAVVVAVDAAIAALGGLDAVVYAAGTLRMGPVFRATPDDWRAVLETNVVGVGLVFARAARELVANSGQLVVMSSYALRTPKAGLVPYMASKAALQALLTGLRVEHPEVRFTTAVLGGTGARGGGMTRDVDPRVRDALTDRWITEGSLPNGWMSYADVAAQIIGVLDSPLTVEELVLQGPALRKGLAV